MTTERKTRIAIAVICVLMFCSWIAYAFEQYDRRQRQEALKARIEALEAQFANDKKLFDQRKK